MRVKIDKLDDFGRGIAYINNKICFIDNALPNEEVEIEITNDKSKYLEAKVTSYIKLSNDRIKPKCPYYDQCGGCNLEHLNIEKENEFKINKVKNILSKYSDINLDINSIICNDEYSYRNKIILHCANKNIGLYHKKSNDVIKIDKCLLVNDRINSLISSLKDLDRVEEIEIRTSNDQKQVLLSIDGSIEESLISKLKEEVDVLIVDNKVVSDKDKIITSVGEKEYYLSKDAFFQVNIQTTKDLYDEVLRIVKEIKPNKVLDLYCGTGSIGIYISEYVKDIIGIDISSSAITNANQNKKLNNIRNISFINNKVENEIDKFKDIDLIIVDPPRSGLDKKTRSYLNTISPQSIIYVSCDPITLARDIKELKENYVVKDIKLFNMFPRTYHCESIAVLERK